MLLDYAHFAPVFAPFAGKFVGLYVLSGNVGDALITKAAGQLLTHFGARWRVLNRGGLQQRLLDEVDEVAVTGGGNMGRRYPACWAERAELRRRTRQPITILPQSFTDDGEDAVYDRVFVRERASLALCRQPAVLAPDLALGYRLGGLCPPPRLACGLLLRHDSEAAAGPAYGARDPAALAHDPHRYLCLAARYATIITDRLHFAIAGLLCGRQVTLVANNYHKNVSMWETWLRDLGCQFTTRAALADWLAEASPGGAVTTPALQRRES